MQPANPTESAELARVAQSVAERSSRILGDVVQRQGEMLSSVMRDELGIAKAFMDLYARLAANPTLVASEALSLWLDYLRLWQAAWMKLFGVDVPPVAEPAKGDWRFKDDEWSKNFVFDYLKQSYLITARHMQQAVAQVKGLPPESQRKVAFFTRQFVDALAPSNFLMTNPQVLRETIATGGENLVRGMNNLLRDLERGGGQLRVSMTDETAFQLGRILDLREKNSFIRWAVEQGHTVFVMSWVNPDARLAEKGFDDYMVEGPLAAMDAVRRATGEHELNFIGYCLGGTLLASTLGYLAAKHDDRVKSATYFVSLLDFSEPGELGVFIDDQTVNNLERTMNERGYLEGSEMAGTFNLMRANDLVWSFVVNNYLMGKDPFPFDLLYWNADSTRMPARMHSFYLRNMYLKNLLGVPGGISLRGVPIDLSQVKVPSYFISTVEDHIAPWKTTYKGARYLGGTVRFVLGGSGHIAGIVNPPAAKKYHYWTNPDLPPDANDWFSVATQQPGSWWEDWQRWIDKLNGGDKVPARIPAHALEDAPGSYAMMRLK
jgi:polyhydroxyalkanoate synthase